MTLERTAVGAVIYFASLVFFITIIQAFFFAPEAEALMPENISSTTILTRVAVIATSSRAVPAAKKMPADPEAPLRLVIPSISVDAAVQQVGLTKKYAMGTPTNFTDVGWYRYGTLPGETGSAVIDGHVDNGLGFDGVFKNLQELRIGDDVYVTKAGGERLHFVVTELASFPYDEVPTDILFNRNDGVRLNLVTCTGDWVHEGKTYDRRLVVFTELTPL